MLLRKMVGSLRQCIEVYVASQGRNKEEALTNLSEALELHFEEPQADIFQFLSASPSP